MGEFLAARLEKDTQYLRTIFPDTGCMDGTIIVLNGENGYDKYTSMLGDPMQEETLIVEDDKGKVMIFFNHLASAAVGPLWPNVSIASAFSYTAGCIIHKKRKIANVPSHIMSHVMRLSYSDVEKKLKAMKLDGGFFSRNYGRGGFIPIKDVRKHPEWRPAYEKNVEVKRIHVCKSCRGKARKGCCPEYSPGNRVMIKAVLGWS